MAVQIGRDDLLSPIKVRQSELRFEFDVDVNLDGDVPNFLGKFAQGPKHSRFVYLSSGRYARQADTCWARRAKLPLTMITREQIRKVLNKPGSCLETVVPGIGSDGGPTCASVKDIEWKAVEK
ncbi:MAG TPA: DUF5990 family protein [Pyrinomonadaceae bacterium]